MRLVGQKRSNEKKEKKKRKVRHYFGGTFKPHLDYESIVEL